MPTLAVFFAALMACPAMAKGGFDEYGYNNYIHYQARIFNGKFGNADRSMRLGGGGEEHYKKRGNEQ